jgi:KaiC/GvpD/RAD55 family RecA-like ATPase
MHKGETLFVNLRNGLNSKPNLIDIKEDINKHITTRDKDWYVSLYKYNETHKKLLEEKGSLAGVKDTLTNTLYFDFDSKEDPTKAQADAIEVANRLITRGFDEDEIGCYFTGNKGFSIEVETNDYLTPDKFKAIVFDVAGDLATFDAVVNDPNRIVRIANTKHQNSGLYKIPLTPDELVNLDIKEIKLLAKNPRANRMLKVASLPQNIKDVEPVKEKPIEAISKELTFDISTIDMKARPKGIDEARFLLLNGFFRSGERNHSMLCLASTLHNLNYPLEVTRGMLNGAAELQSSRTGESVFPEREVDLIINQVYGPNWKGGQFTTRDPNNWLAQYVKKMGLNVKENEGPETLDGIEAGFTSYLNNIEKNTIKTGIDAIDKAMPITVGSNIGVVAAAGAGKTALALKILRYNSENGIPTVFASLDMHRNRLFEKVIYNVTGFSREDVYAKFKAGKGKELTDLVKKHYGNVWFYDRSSATVEDIKNYVLAVEQKTGEKVKMVMFDYFERINCDVSEDTAASKKIASQIQDMVNDLDVAAITLVQPNKFSLGAGPDTEIKSYTSIKGSSFLYQSFRGIISLSRPFYTPATKDIDKYMVINLLKNDLGELDRFEFGWHGKTGEIYELEDHEKDELKELMRLKNSTNEDTGWE